MATAITTTIKTTTTTNGTSCVLWLVPLLLFCGCFKKDPWTVTTVRTGNPEYDSAKLAYSSKDPVNGIDLELVRVEERVRIYLVVHAQPITAYPAEPKTALVKISSEEERKVILAHLRDGGQRVLLPDSIHPFIIDTLKQGKPLTFQLPGYRTTIVPSDFSTRYDELQHPHLPMPKMKLPI